MKAWRESASLIIAARSGLKHNKLYDYKLLLLKRQVKTSFGGTFVFPGGVIESADADLKWQNLFKGHGYNENSFKSLIPSVNNRPQIFQSKENELPREISLRISAIRETFEECGILLCKKSSESPTACEKAHHLSTNFEISNHELEIWQDKVHCNAEEFYNLCEKFQCYPNLWALYEWENWLTPTFFPTSMRFDTIFFFTSLSQIPNSKVECGEIEELVWATPKHSMTSLRAALPPPQRYEISRIGKYKNLDDLSQFAVEKSKSGVQMFLPVRAILLDGSVNILPGDSMYPEKVDKYKQEVIDKSNMTIKQFRDISPKTHRIEFFDDPENEDNHLSKL